MNRSCSLPPPGKEVTGAMSHNCHMKNTAEACCDCQMSIGDARLCCCQVQTAGLACKELKMQKGLSDNVTDKITHLTVKEK